MKKGTLISVGGPTASGKTSLSIALAQKFNTEIISFDSRQFYNEMTIGTAVPSEDELESANHYFIQDRSIHEPLTAGKFGTEARLFLDNYFKTNPILIAVGGSGLYEKALAEGIQDLPEVPEEIVEDLEKRLIDESLTSLQEELKNVDYESFISIDIQNSRRLIRALSIYKFTKKPLSLWRKEQKQEPLPYRFIPIGIQLDREYLYQRINLRVDQMLKQGLIEEVESLIQFKEKKPLQTVGYQEVFKFFEGEFSREEMIEEIKKNTRRFAKRQLTWFNNQTERTWIRPSEFDRIQKIIENKV